MADPCGITNGIGVCVRERGHGGSHTDGGIVYWHNAAPVAEAPTTWDIRRHDFPCAVCTPCEPEHIGASTHCLLTDCKRCMERMTDPINGVGRAPENETAGPFALLLKKYGDAEFDLGALPHDKDNRPALYAMREARKGVEDFVAALHQQVGELRAARDFYVTASERGLIVGNNLLQEKATVMREAAALRSEMQRREVEVAESLAKAGELAAALRSDLRDALTFAEHLPQCAYIETSIDESDCDCGLVALRSRYTGTETGK